MNTTDKPLIPYLELGSAFVLGMAVGVAVKKSFKVLLVIVGLGLILIFSLEHQGAIHVNEANLESSIAIGVDKFQSMISFLENRLESYQATGRMSAIAGFLVGLKYA